MNPVIDIVLPVFGLIGIGYAVAAAKLLPAGTDQALADFVFVIPIPLLIFRTVASADFSGGSPIALWAAYYAAFGIIWLAGTQLTRRLFGRDARAGVVAGISAAYSNTLLVGIPLIIAAYGAEGTAAISLLIAVHLPIMMSVSAVLIERALVADGVKSAAAGPRKITRSVGRNLALNPIVLGLVAGLAWRLTGLVLPSLARGLVDRLADMAATVALFSMGMSLRTYGISGHVQPALVLTVLKLLIMPAIVFIAAFYVIPLPPVWAKAIVIAAACPSGVNTYLVAARFRTGQALASNTITLTAAGSLVTVAAWLHFLERF